MYRIIGHIPRENPGNYMSFQRFYISGKMGNDLGEFLFLGKSVNQYFKKFIGEYREPICIFQSGDFLQIRKRLGGFRQFLENSGEVAFFGAIYLLDNMYCICRIFPKDPREIKF